VLEQQTRGSSSSNDLLYSCLHSRSQSLGIAAKPANALRSKLLHLPCLLAYLPTCGRFLLCFLQVQAERSTDPRQQPGAAWSRQGPHQTVLH
jgi:hypothetical protein